MTFTASQNQILWTITHVSSSLSIAGSTFIILSFLIFKNMRRAHSHFIFWLSICDLCSSIAWLAIPADQSDALCISQGMIMQFFQIASFAWTASIAISLYMVLVKKITDFGYMTKYFHIVTWFMAALDVFFGYMFNVFGDANPDVPGARPSWCWIKYDDTYAKLGLYFIPFFICWIFNLVIYIRVTGEIAKIKSLSIRNIAESKIRLYLLVFMLCVGVGAVNRIQNFIRPDSPQFWLYVCDAVVSPLQGFLNSIVYGMNRQLRMKWQHILCCGCLKEGSSYEPILTVNRPTERSMLISGKTTPNSTRSSEYFTK